MFMGSPSKNELRAYLHQPRSHRAHYLAKRPAADVAVNRLRPKKLRVVENVEGFQAKLQRFRFGQAQVLEKRHIEVFHSGPVEIAPRSVAWSAEGVVAEQRAIEIGLAVARIVIQI